MELCIKKIKKGKHLHFEALPSEGKTIKKDYPFIDKWPLGLKIVVLI